MQSVGGGGGHIAARRNGETEANTRLMLGEDKKVPKEMVDKSTQEFQVKSTQVECFPLESFTSPSVVVVAGWVNHLESAQAWVVAQLADPVVQT